MKKKKKPNPEARMGLLAHIQELRKRLVLILIGLAVGTLAGWYLYEPVLEFIQRPLTRLENAHVSINFQTIGAAFDLKLTVALWISLIITSPWWITQIGIFVIPALKRKERLYAGFFGVTGVALFLAGAALGVWVTPRAVEILQSFVPDSAVSLLQANAYVQFYMRLVIAFGFSFLIPEILVALNFAGILRARTMLRGWRWATIVAFVFAAIVNPLPSPWPMILQACMLIGLYLLAVLISWIHERIAARRQRTSTGAQREKKK